MTGLTRGEIDAIRVRAEWSSWQTPKSDTVKLLSEVERLTSENEKLRAVLEAARPAYAIMMAALYVREAYRYEPQEHPRAMNALDAEFGAMEGGTHRLRAAIEAADG